MCSNNSQAPKEKRFWVRIITTQEKKNGLLLSLIEILLAKGIYISTVCSVSSIVFGPPKTKASGRSGVVRRLYCGCVPQQFLKVFVKP